jgi:Fe-S-cluster-containing hydrogenase component 2
MERRTLIINPEKCTGCRDCEMVCSLYHERTINPSRSRIVVIRDPLNGIELPTICMQCEEPICMMVCPVNAIYEDENGAKIIDYERCMGCRTCVISCPLGGALIDPVSGKTIKCDLCDGEPRCVKFCFTKAIEYVPISVANQRIKRATIDRYLTAMKERKI